MESEKIFYGKDLNDNDLRVVEDFVDSKSTKGLFEINGEFDKTNEEIKYIKTINQYINEEIKDLGLKKEIKLDLNRIHILDSESYNKKFGNTTNGIYNAEDDKSVIKYNSNRMQMYKTILHETLHSLSFKKFNIVSDSDNSVIVFFTRNGYSNLNISEKSHEHFRGFNEGVTDAIVKDILLKHKYELMKDFKIREKEFNDIYYYNDNIEIIETIVDRIAEKTNQDRESIWNKIKIGEFNGDMMYIFREIEKTFGTSSLRVLAAMGSGTKNPSSLKDTKTVLSYFQSNNEIERDSIAKEVLSNRELSAYKYNKRKISEYDNNKNKFSDK